MLIGCQNRSTASNGNTFFIPEDAHGAMILSCFGETAERIDVVFDGSGLAEAKLCPRENSDIRIMKGNKVIHPTGNLGWIRDKNGVVIAITFETQ